jgi:hypothetical protein
VITNSQHVYEVRPRKDRRGVDLISDALPFGLDPEIGHLSYHNVKMRFFDPVMRMKRMLAKANRCYNEGK